MNNNKSVLYILPTFYQCISQIADVLNIINVILNEINGIWCTVTFENVCLFILWISTDNRSILYILSTFLPVHPQIADVLKVINVFSIEINGNWCTGILGNDKWL